MEFGLSSPESREDGVRQQNIVAPNRADFHIPAWILAMIYPKLCGSMRYSISSPALT